MLKDTNIKVPLYSLDLACRSLDTFADIKNPINEPSGNFFYDTWKLKPEFQGTVWEKLLNYLPSDIGEARIIKLESSKCYLQHADIDDRYHLNLSGENTYLIDIDNQEMHPLKNDGIVYEMDAGRIHSAINLGVYDRYQLVIRKLLKQAKSREYSQISITPICKKARFVFDNEVSPLLNYLNKCGSMNNFNYNTDCVSFALDNNFISYLDKIDSNNFSIKINSISDT